LLLDNVFEHLDQPETCLKEAYRVLKQRGRLMIVVPNLKGWHLDPTHIIYWDEANLPPYLKQHNFHIVTQKHHPLPKFIGDTLWAYNLFFVVAEKSA